MNTPLDRYLADRALTVHQWRPQALQPNLVPVVLMGRLAIDTGHRAPASASPRARRNPVAAADRIGVRILLVGARVRRRIAGLSAQFAPVPAECRR